MVFQMETPMVFRKAAVMAKFFSFDVAMRSATAMESAKFFSFSVKEPAMVMAILSPAVSMISSESGLASAISFSRQRLSFSGAA
jgi:hypothetical protein